MQLKERLIYSIVRNLMRKNKKLIYKDTERDIFYSKHYKFSYFEWLVRKVPTGKCLYFKINEIRYYNVEYRQFYNETIIGYMSIADIRRKIVFKETYFNEII